MHFDGEIVDSNPVLDVPIEAISFLDEDCTAGRIRFQEREHLAEPCTARLLSGLDVDELSEDGELLLAGVLSQQFLLRGDREPFALLILRADTTVRDANFACIRRYPFRHVRRPRD